MKLGIATLAAAAGALVVLLASSYAGGAEPSALQSDAQVGAPPKVQTMYGHIRSLVRKGVRYELRIDPALWLSGMTANRAAEQDKVIVPGEGVPNDYYIREEGHRLLTFRVPASARATVVSYAPLKSVRIPISELAQIVKGKNPRHRPLFDHDLGYWIRFSSDTVLSLDAQYQP